MSLQIRVFGCIDHLGWMASVAHRVPISGTFASGGSAFVRLASLACGPAAGVAARLRTVEEQMTLAVPLAHFAPRGSHDMWAIIAVGDAGRGQ